MPRDESDRTLEESMLLLQQEAKNRPISIGKILTILSGKGRPLLLIILSLPFCQPIQIPGLSIPFGLAIAFLGLRMIFRQHMWLPDRLSSKTITTHALEQMIEATLRVVRWVRPWIHPRLQWVCRSYFMETMNGAVILLLGFLLALPLPIPFSNMSAAWALFFVALGVLEDDGACVLVGYGLFLLTIVFFAAVTLSMSYFF